MCMTAPASSIASLRQLSPDQDYVHAVAGAGSEDAAAAISVPAPTLTDLPQPVLHIVLGHLGGRDAARAMGISTALAAAVRSMPEIDLVLDLDASPVASRKPRSHTKKRQRHASAWCGWPLTMHRKRALATVLLQLA